MFIMIFHWHNFHCVYHGLITMLKKVETKVCFLIQSYSLHSGNFVAVGSFDPEIQIWDLDVINALDPVCVLGGRKATEPSSSKKKVIRSVKAYKYVEEEK